MKIKGLQIDTPPGGHLQTGGAIDQKNRKLLRLSVCSRGRCLSHHLEEVFLVPQSVDDAQQRLVLSFS
jgi:hypothetical protein